MAETVKPFVIVTSIPIYGHMTPLRLIAKDLSSRGYPVTFLGASIYRQSILDIERWPERNKIPPGPAQIVYDIETKWLAPMPDQHKGLQQIMQSLKKKDPNRPVVVVTESTFFGVLPMLLGAGERPAGVLSIGIVPLMVSSVDLAPYRGLHPDSSEEGRARNLAMTKAFQEDLLGGTQAKFQDLLEELGAKRPDHFLFDCSVLNTDVYLQMCIPSVEYPRSDMPSSVRFAGGLPRGSQEVWNEKPAWWDEIAVNPQGKKIIAVAQGSKPRNIGALIVPTLEALKDRDDVLVVAALGSKGSKLPEGTLIPENARVLDYVPFDELLAYTDLFVTNGGYGGFQHALAHGVPLVVAGGTGEDKPEVAARAEWARVGTNLRNATPSPDVVRKGVEEVLSNPEFKARAMTLQAEMGTYKPFQVVADTIEELAKRR